MKKYVRMESGGKVWRAEQKIGFGERSERRTKIKRNFVFEVI